MSRVVLASLPAGPDRYGMSEAAASPPGGILPGQMQDAFIGADALRFSDPIAAEEQALIVPRAGGEKVHVLWVVFPAQRAGLGVEGLDPVCGAVFEFGQDHFPRGQLVGQHARILAPGVRIRFPPLPGDRPCHT